MKKVGILMYQNMRYAPFLKMYTGFLDTLEDVQYDIVYFNRDRDLHEEATNNIIPIKWVGKGKLGASKKEKLFNGFVYRNQVRKLLKERQYNFLIILTTYPAVLLNDVLCNCYPKRYLIDIRDYSQESFKPYYDLEKKVFGRAAMCVISSPGFVNFLPKRKYYLCHNLDPTAQKTVKREFKKAKKKIRIGYIGTISYEKECEKLIDLVSHDDRFEFFLWGNEAREGIVSDYVKRTGNSRIKMMGAFLPREKEEIYDKVDLVFNCYGNESTLVKYAISNKYYDGAIYKKPLLVSPHTSMADIEGKHGYALDLKKIQNLNGLYDWYQELNEKEFVEFADGVIQKAVADNEKYLHILTKKIGS